MKKIFYAAAALLSLTAAHTANAEVYTGTCGGGFYGADAAACSYSWNTADSTLTISGTGEMTSRGWSSYSSYIKRVSISGVTSIGGYAFEGCSALTQVTIPNSVTSIGSEAFYGCSALTQVTIPNSVTSIGYAAFRYCRALTAINVDANNQNYASVDGVLFNKSKKTLIHYPNGKGSTYTIPNSVDSIGEYAFLNGNGTGMNKLIIEDGSSKLYLSPYYYPEDRIVVDTLYLGRTITGNFSSYLLPFGTALKKVTIGGKVTALPTYTFYGNADLKEITIPNSVTSIGGSAFNGCSRLKEVIIEDGASELDVVNYYSNYPSSHPESFYRCHINTLYLGRNITYAAKPNLGSDWRDADASPFSTALNTITIGGSVSALPQYAFKNNTGLTAVHNHSAIPQTIGSDVFNGITLTDVDLYVPSGSLAAYQAANVWKNFSNILAASGGGGSGCTSLSCLRDSVDLLKAQLAACRSDNPTAVTAEALPQLEVYPNPAGDMLYITDAFAGNVEIYSITGTLVLVSDRAAISIAHLSTGTYIVKAGNKAAKVVKR